MPRFPQNWTDADEEEYLASYLESGGKPPLSRAEMKESQRARFPVGWTDADEEKYREAYIKTGGRPPTRTEIKPVAIPPQPPQLPQPPPGKSRCSICGKVGSTGKLRAHEAKCKGGKCPS